LIQIRWMSSAGAWTTVYRSIMYPTTLDSTCVVYCEVT
jgi:hypothetical protein